MKNKKQVKKSFIVINILYFIARFYYTIFYKFILFDWKISDSNKYYYWNNLLN